MDKNDLNNNVDQVVTRVFLIVALFVAIVVVYASVLSQGS